MIALRSTTARPAIQTAGWQQAVPHRSARIRLGAAEVRRLISLAQSGDEAACAAVVRHYAGPTIRSIRRLGIPASLHEDAFQEGCLALVQAVQRFDTRDPQPFAGFAWRCVRQRLCMLLRHDQRRLAQSGIPWQAPAPGDGHDLPEIAELQKLLSDSEARVIRHLYGLGDAPSETLRSLAGQLGCSHEQVRSLHKRAIEKLTKEVRG